MDKPAAIRQLQTALRLELQPFPGPPEQLEELTRYRYQNPTPSTPRAAK